MFQLRTHRRATLPFVPYKEERGRHGINADSQNGCNTDSCFLHGSIGVRCSLLPRLRIYVQPGTSLYVSLLSTTLNLCKFTYVASADNPIHGIDYNTTGNWAYWLQHNYPILHNEHPGSWVYQRFWSLCHHSIILFECMEPSHTHCFCIPFWSKHHLLLPKYSAHIFHVCS